MLFFRLRTYGWVLLFALFTLVLLYHFLFVQDDLHPNNISANFQPRSEWEISVHEPEEVVKIDQIFDMPFVYLNEGGQSYVFSSIDQKYVLKLFKFRRFQPSFFIKFLPHIFPFKNYRERHIAKRKNKLKVAFNGYKLAYDIHQKESGLIFIQLNPSNKSRWVTLVDKEKNTRRVNLEKVSYVLQEKGEMLSTDLSRILDQGNLPLAKQRIDQVLKLYLAEYRKGICDLDHGIMHNIGCIDNRLFHLDVGKFIADERIKQSEFYQKDLLKIASKLRSWIDQRYPQYAHDLTEYMNESLSSILDKKK